MTICSNIYESMSSYCSKCFQMLFSIREKVFLIQMGMSIKNTHYQYYKKIKNQIFFMIMQYPTILNQRKKTTQLHIFRLSFIVDKYYWKRWEKCCSLREMRSEAADQCSKASESHVVLLWYWYQYAKLSA